MNSLIITCNKSSSRLTDCLQSEVTQVYDTSRVHGWWKLASMNNKFASINLPMVPPTVQLKIGHAHRVTWPIVWWTRRYVEKKLEKHASKMYRCHKHWLMQCLSVSWWAAVFRGASTCLNQRWNSRRIPQQCGCDIIWTWNHSTGGKYHR